VIHTVNITLKKDESKTLGSQEECVAIQDSSNSEEIPRSFESLEIQERNLTEQKEHLKALLAQLETKAEEEIEKRKRKVDRLNSDVSNLKQRCEKIAKWINLEQTSGRSEADP
jgi:arsenate reductase-like glutaredoxin family protein